MKNDIGGARRGYRITDQISQNHSSREFSCRDRLDKKHGSSIREWLKPEQQPNGLVARR